MASDLQEAQDIAKQLLVIGKEFAPTLLKYIKPCSTTLKKKQIQVFENTTQTTSSTNDEVISVTALEFDVNLQKIMRNIAFANGYTLDDNIAAKDIHKLMSELDPHDALPREFELGTITFKIKSDYGSYYDMKRHRIATLITPTTLNPNFFITPKICDTNYIEAMNKIAKLYKKWAHLPEASYMLTNAFQKEYIIKMNPRELFEIIRLRGFGEGGHSSYRAIGMQMYDIAIKQCPEIFAHINNWKQDNKESKDFLDQYTLTSTNENT